MPLTKEQATLYKIGEDNFSKLLQNLYHVNVRLDPDAIRTEQNKLDALLIGGTMKNISDSIKLINEYFASDGLLKFTDKQILKINDSTKNRDNTLCHHIRSYIYYKNKPFNAFKKSFIKHPCILCQLYLNDGYIMTPKDVDMIMEYICPETYRPLDIKTSKLCSKQHNHLVRVLKEAQNLGKIPIYVPKPYENPPEPPVYTIKPKGVRYKIPPINTDYLDYINL